MGVFMPAFEDHPEFADYLRRAYAAGGHKAVEQEMMTHIVTATNAEGEISFQIFFPRPDDKY